MDAAVEIVAASDSKIDRVRELWTEYWDSVGLPASFQGFDAECTGLPGAYAPPNGRLLIARVGGECAGTIALRPLQERACEAKRLYVRPRYRGRGIGRSLLDRLIREARETGYEEMFGDPLPSMASALEMYRAVGFREAGPYSKDPTPGAIFLRLDLMRRAL